MTQNLYYLKYLHNDFLKEFENYNNIMEDYLLKNYFNKTKTDITELNIDLSTLDEKELIDYDKKLLSYSQKFYEQSIFYPQSFRSSFFIQIFSVLEYELKEISLIYHKQNNTDFSLYDLKGNSEIEKAKLYFKKACKIDFESFEEWAYLDLMRKIRNRFVHSQGEINRKHGDWYKIFKFIEDNRNLLGFRNCAEYLDKDKFKELFDDDYLFMLDIQSSDFNKKIIFILKDFLRKLLLELEPSN